MTSHHTTKIAGVTTGACRSCKAAVTWATTTGEKSAPFEADPAGAWVIDEAGVARQYTPQLGLFVVSPPRFTSHFATCPDAATWRAARQVER